MPDSETKQLADSFLQEAVARLATLSYSELSSWPDWPDVPDSGVVAPDQLAAYIYTVMKDSRPDGSIRIAIQRYRNIRGPLGEMVAEGFFIHSDGEIVWMVESDKWEVT